MIDNRGDGIYDCQSDGAGGWARRQVAAAMEGALGLISGEDRPRAVVRMVHADSALVIDSDKWDTISVSHVYVDMEPQPQNAIGSR